MRTPLSCGTRLSRRDLRRSAHVGAPNEEQTRVHRLVGDSQRAGIEALKADAITCAEVDRIARDVIADAGYQDLIVIE